MCAFCRMVISDRHFAAQLVAKGEEPRFFDDIGCLRDYVAGGAAPQDAVSYVADHRTGAWVLASRAVYTWSPKVATPMDSHLLAHADDASRGADTLAASGARRSFEEVFAR